jgi:hypothetical protein
VSAVLREARVLSGHDAYDELPEIIRHLYTPQQWLWLSDGQKARLVQSECEPDHTE